MGQYYILTLATLTGGTSSALSSAGPSDSVPVGSLAFYQSGPKMTIMNRRSAFDCRDRRRQRWGALKPTGKEKSADVLSGIEQFFRTTRSASEHAYLVEIDFPKDNEQIYRSQIAIRRSSAKHAAKSSPTKARSNNDLTNAVSACAGEQRMEGFL